jgi:hypothetical protein
VVELVRLSMRQNDALCVLLTGRSETGFSDLIKRMVAAKKLEFDMITLKPAVGPDNQRFSSTMVFKQRFLTTLMETYAKAEEIRIYEDRPRHIEGFRKFLDEYNDRQRGFGGGMVTRGPIDGEVIPVLDVSASLDPIAEVTEVQHIVMEHNEAFAKGVQGFQGEKLKINKTVFYTGYLINAADTEKLLRLMPLPRDLPDGELRLFGNNVMICPRPCPPSILEKVGGMGAKLRWEVTGTAVYDNSIWAASLRPVPPTARFHTDNSTPFVILALRGKARAADAQRIRNWQPVPPDKALTFEGTVGEKVLLRIDTIGGERYGNNSVNVGSRRRNDTSHTVPSGPSGHANGNKPFSRNFHHQPYPMDRRRGSGQGGRGGFRGNGTPNRGHRNASRGGGGGRGGRGGRGGHGYRSLDDVDARGENNSGVHGSRVVYDEDVQMRAPPTYAAAVQGYGQGGHVSSGGWQAPSGGPSAPGRTGAGQGGQGYGGDGGLDY